MTFCDTHFIDQQQEKKMKKKAKKESKYKIHPYRQKSKTIIIILKKGEAR
jgi:hypothetical protein